MLRCIEQGEAAASIINPFNRYAFSRHWLSCSCNNLLKARAYHIMIYNVYICYSNNHSYLLISIVYVYYFSGIVAHARHREKRAPPWQIWLELNFWDCCCGVQTSSGMFLQCLTGIQVEHGRTLACTHWSFSNSWRIITSSSYFAWNAEHKVTNTTWNYK